MRTRKERIELEKYTITDFWLVFLQEMKIIFKLVVFWTLVFLCLWVLFY